MIYPVEGAYPLHFPELTPWPIASTTFLAGFKFPKTVGSPIDREIIFLSGFGVKVMVSNIFRIGLNVFLDIMDARTLFHDGRLFLPFWFESPFMLAIELFLICHWAPAVYFYRTRILRGRECRATHKSGSGFWGLVGNRRHQVRFNSQFQTGPLTIDRCSVPTEAKYILTI